MKNNSNLKIQTSKFQLRAFTLIELIISVALLIVAISIALFATIGVGGLIQRSEARGTISEAGRSVSDEVRRVVNNAPVGGVSLLTPYGAAGTPDGTYAAIQVKDYSTSQSSNTCSVIGRANVASSSNGEETYTLTTAGSLVVLMIYKVDAAGLCPSVSTTPIYQNRLTASASKVKELRFYLQTISCTPITPPTCITKQLLRSILTLELVAKIGGNTTESKKPTLTLQDGLPIGLVNEVTSGLTILSSNLADGTVGSGYADSVVVAGGVPSYTWALNSGSNPLPGGLNLASSTGIISGTPTTAGTFNFTVKVTDSNGSIATKLLTILIGNATAPSPLTITTTTLPSATPGSTYSANVAATGGSSPYVWQITTADPALSWLVFTNPTTGSLGGAVPLGVTAGTYNVTIKVTDTASATDTKTLQITISGGGPPPPPGGP